MKIAILLGIVLSAGSAFAGTTYGKVCRVEMSPESGQHHVAVALAKAGTVCPSVASALEWKYFYGVSNAQGLTTGLFTEAELQTVFMVMWQTKIAGGSVNISYSSSVPNQALYFIFL